MKWEINIHSERPYESRIYKTCILPLIIYGAETRSETNEIQTVRATMRYKLHGTQIKIDLRGKCQNDDIVERMRKRRREWNQHVSRMTTDRMANNISHGRRPFVRLTK